MKGTGVTAPGDAVMLPIVEHFWAAQPEHVWDPALLEYPPTAHGGQGEEEVVAFDAVPTWHGAQLLPALEKVPAGQGEQVLFTAGW